MALHIGHSALVVTIVGILGNIISIMVYLAPLPTYYRIYKKKSTQGFESVPYVVALFSAMLWLYYALLKEAEYFLISINSIGCIIEMLYIGFYYAYAPTKARICTAKLVLALNLGVFSIIVIIIQLLVGDRNRIHVLGYICAIVTTNVFAAPLTIMVKVIRTKSVEFMPFPLSFFLTLCAVTWFAYGFLRQDPFVYIPNIFGFVLGLLQMILYAVCKNCCFSKELDMNVADSGASGVVTNLETADQRQQTYSDKPGWDTKADHQDSRSNEDHSKLESLDHSV